VFERREELFKRRSRRDVAVDAGEDLQPHVHERVYEVVLVRQPKAYRCALFITVLYDPIASSDMESEGRCNCRRLGPEI
jgi:hypothetical protein